MKNAINTMVNNVNYMEQYMIGIKYKFIESDYEKVKQYVNIDELIREIF